ncbi:MAG TPA: hypothetical protein PK839_10525 [Tenuifilaceae bacterium]|nr:hypothetical protein [Tenuifilaceae bacterium]
MEPAKTILHIGYPKTATKWFQKKFYPKLNNIFFVKREEVFKWLAFRNIFDYSPVNTLEHLAGIANRKRLVICDEIILGGLDIGFGSGEYVYMMANRLRETFCDASIVIFIRNQHDALESAYSHYIKAGGTYSVKNYLGISKKFTRPFQNYHFFNSDLFQYSSIIGLYSKLFGRENVHVYLYEDFQSNIEVFINQFCTDFDLLPDGELNFQPTNVRLPFFSIRLMRLFNHFTAKNTIFKHYFFSLPRFYRILQSGVRRLAGILPFNRPFTFSSDIHSWIDERFRMSNRQLSDWVDMDKLKDYGYPL